MLISRRAKYSLGVLIMAGLTLVGTVVSAMSFDCPSGKSVYVPPDEEEEVTEEPEVPEVTMGCNSTAETIKHYLLAAGYDNNAASGILGNLSAESCTYRHKAYCSCDRPDAEDGFKAYVLSGGSYVLNSSMTRSCGFGLVQWTPDSNSQKDRLLRLQKYADGKAAAITDLNIQIEFILRELTTTEIDAYYYNVLRPEKLNGRSIEDTTWRIEKWYESPNAVAGSPGYGQYREVCSDSTSSWCRSYKKRLERAQEALSIADCTPSTGEERPTGSEPTEEDPMSEEPTEVPVVTQPPEQPESYSETGALGEQSARNMVSQTDSGVKNTAWLSRSSDKKIGVYDSGDCCGSGCSLVAVGNAYGALHGYNQSQIADYINTLASWTKSHISSPSRDNTKTIIEHTGMTPDKIWTSKSTSVDTKIAAIRSALASGRFIVAGGDRGETRNNPNYCTTAKKASGGCVFTPGGHYIAIIGITADNKLVVANPGKSNDRTWIFPPDDILNHSDIAFSVK